MGVTINDIAERAGVSRGTVDRALNHRGRIDPEVQAKIMNIAAELGYVQKERKKRSAAPRGKRIGVVTQLAKASFMIDINRGIETAKKELEDLDFEVIVKPVASVDDQEQLEAIEALERQGISALAIMPVDSEIIREKLNFLTKEKGIPVVTFNSDISGTRRSCFVGMDNNRSGRTAAGLMKMLTGGIGKVLIITGYFDSWLNNYRVAGFVDELKQIAPALEIAGVQASFNQEEEVQQIVEKALMNISGITGIYVVSGGQRGVAEAFEALHIEKRPMVILHDKIPENVKLLQEDKADFVIDQNGYEQGYRPLRILTGILLNNEKPGEELMYMGIDIRTRYNI